jgi:hypothetical protein
MKCQNGYATTALMKVSTAPQSRPVERRQTTRTATAVRELRRPQYALLMAICVSCPAAGGAASDPAQAEKIPTGANGGSWGCPQSLSKIRSCSGPRFRGSVPTDVGRLGSCDFLSLLSVVFDEFLDADLDELDLPLACHTAGPLLVSPGGPVPPQPAHRPARRRHDRQSCRSCSPTTHHREVGHEGNRDRASD